MFDIDPIANQKKKFFFPAFSAQTFLQMEKKF